MFALQLFTNKSEDTKLDKELNEIVTLNGVLKDGCSILNPVIQVSEFNNAMAAICNYAFIPDFARRYFITDIINVRNNLWELHMKVDVLSTYAAQIRQNKAVIIRQENRYNMMLNDPMFGQQQDKQIQIKNFACNFEQVHYILTVVGG